MLLYKKKPIQVVASKLSEVNSEEIASWCNGIIVEEVDTETNTTQFIGLDVPTIRGTILVSDGDYLVKESDTPGDFWACAPDIFEAAYEAV